MVVSLLWFQPSFLHTIQAITDVLPWMIAGSFSASALILTYSYHHTQVAHLRRQIRVIGFAFAWVVLAWLAIISVPTVFNNYHLVANRLIDMTAVGIPLAYLVTIFNRDLYRLDTLIARLTVHATTLITLILMSNLLKHWFHVTSVTALLWQGVYCLILYQPLMRLVMHYVPMIGHPSFDILHAAQTRLTTTLDTQILSTIIVNAVSATFGKPAYAWYDGDSGQTNSLALTHCNRFEVPAHLSAGAFTTHLLSIPAVYESRRLYDDVRDVILDEAEEQTIFHSGIVLWCPIRHKDGFLLGLLLLGMRGDVDPYRIRDQQALSQFLAATALALTNGVTYTQQCKAEQHIRHLYQQLHQVQADTAYQIARRLHDEVLNIYVRLNIEAIQRLLVHYQEGTLHDELTLLLESERGISDELRLICEQLSPTGIHDPFALTTVLRTHVEKMSGLWSGTCTFLVYGQPRPIPSDQQRETLNIVKEALINAIKHAEATQISVTLTYPDDQHAGIKIEVSDNGPTIPRIQVKPGHFGLRNMQESSNIMNATLTIDASSTGTRVRLWLPIPTDEQASIARSFITV